MDSGGEWCTYVQAARRLHKSHGAIRQMALRGQLQRVRGNDGKARVLILPDMERAAHEQPERALSAQPERAAHDGVLVHALESHIKTLQADNEALTQDLAATRADLSAHVASLKTENERLAGQLAGAEARAGEEAAKTAQAIAAFKSLAERLEAIAEARRPWWRRLVG